MLHLCYSNRFEVLCAPLAARVREAQVKDPLTPIQIVAPNPTVEQFIRFDVAEKLGVAANLNVGLLRNFLKRTIEATNPDLSILNKAILQLLLYSRLTNPEFVSGHGLDEVSEYLDHASTPQARQKRSLQLAGELARLFEEYSYSRRGMLDAWRKNRRVLGTESAAIEGWQLRLWRALFDGDQAFRFSGRAARIQGQLDLFQPSSNTHSYMMLVDALHGLADSLELPEQIHIFGLSYVAPAFVELFGRLANRTEIYVYALNPCVEFWEDVQASGLATLQAEWAHRAPMDDAPDFETDDPFGLQQPRDARALRLWGRPGREYVRLLNELTQCQFASGFIDPLDENDSLLAHLQHDILLRAPERTGEELQREPDGSIQILACPSLRREVEIVADKIWASIERSQNDESPLRFHEIAVLVTENDRDRYMAHILDTFAARDRIPFRILDQNLAQRSAVFDAVYGLLDLPTQTVDRRGITRILQHENLVGHSALLQRQWEQWTQDLGVSIGATAADFEGTYMDGRAYHWAQSLDRLLLGHFVPRPPSGTYEPISMTIGDVVPFETATEDRESVALFMMTIRDLLADTQSIRSANLSLTDWSVFLSRLVSRYIDAGDDPIDDIALGRCLRCIEQLRERDLESTLLPYAVVHDLVSAELRRLESGRGQHRADGVVISTLLPMRTLPFRRIFVLGLGEGRFPSVETPNPLDLRQLKRSAGDVSAAERDRYLFLETVLAVRDQLVLSYVAFDGTSGDALEPSPVVREFEFVLQSYLGREGVESLTETHPLSPWHPQYFGEGSDTESSRYATQAHRLSKLSDGWSRQLTVALKQEDAWDTELGALAQEYGWASTPDEPAALPEDISLNALRGFLTSPLQASAQTVLRLFRKESEDGAESEPITMDGRHRLRLLNDVFWSDRPVGEPLRVFYHQCYQRMYLENQAPTGPFGDAAAENDLAILERWRRLAGELDDLAPHLWHRPAVGRCNEYSAISEQLPSLPLRWTADMAPCQLHGVLERIHPDRHLIMVNILAGEPKDGHFLRALLSIVTLSALGFDLPKTIKVMVNSGNEVLPPRRIRDYWVPPQDVAHQWLCTMTQDLFTGFHPYRLPIEVVMNWYRERQRTSDAGPVLRINQRTSDDFGPLDDLSPFSLPDIETADEYVARRFDLILRARHS